MKKERSIAGEKARKWRRGIGALANSGEDTRTRKFPLELPSGEDAFDFAEAARLFDIVEGAGETGPGALAGFLCAAHLSGFRLLSRAKPNPENPEWKSARGLRPNMTVDANIAQDNASPLIRLSPDDAEYELHKVVALVARQAQADGEQTVAAGELQRRILGDDGQGPNGLLWLFGEGFALLGGEKSDREVARMLDADIGRVRQLRARVPPPPPFCGEPHYRKFSQAVAGKIKGWIANYWKRLEFLRKKTEDAKLVPPPSALDDPRARTELFRREDFNFADLQAAHDAMPGLLKDARKALDILAGLHPKKLPGRAEAEKFDELNARMDELAGRLRKLKNIAEQRERSAESRDDEKFWKTLVKALEKSAKPLEKFEKLNRISGGTPDAGEATQDAQDAFNALWGHSRAHLAKLAGESRGMPALLESAEADEAEALRKRGMNPDDAPEDDAPEFAVRGLLRQIANAARKMRPENRDMVAEKIRPFFVRRKDANKHFQNNIGAIYRSPHSRSVHPPFALKWEEARAVDWPAELEFAAAGIESRLNAGNPDDFRDWLALSGLAATLRLRALPEELPREKIDGLADLPQAARNALRFSPTLADDLRKNTVQRRHVVSAFNQLHSAMRGLSFKIMRREFIVRVALDLIRQDELIYAPKEGRWTPPPRYRPFYEQPLAAVAVAADESGALNVPAAAAALLKARRPGTRKNAVLSAADRAFLAELPRDWLFPVDKWKIDAPERTGFRVGKDIAKQDGFAMPAPVRGLRLCGPNSLKTALDDCLRGRVKLGETTLILDRVCGQTFQWRNGKLRLAAEQKKLRAELAVPVKSEAKSQAAEFHHRIVAVDLGERGIGYAVFDIPNALKKGLDKGLDGPRTEKIMPLKTGAVPVTSVRALISAARRHRGRDQPMQKVRDSHSRALEKRRQNVVGDVCHAIDALCARWRAFPVLEKDVRNLESGAKQLLLVYASVLNRYVFSKTDAHKKARAGHWFTGKGSPEWPHPYLVKKRGGGFVLFPGADVRAAGTSQQCSKCGRNPLGIVGKLPKNRPLDFRDGKADLAGNERLFPGKAGNLQIVLRENTVYLGGPDDPKEKRRQRAFRRQGNRPPLARPVSRKIKAGKLGNLIKANLRRPPVRLRSPDTSQSRYRCVFADCRAEMHADINAAVNIGRRFLLENINREQSRQKRGAGEGVKKERNGSGCVV